MSILKGVNLHEGKYFEVEVNAYYEIPQDALVDLGFEVDASIIYDRAIKLYWKDGVAYRYMNCSTFNGYIYTIKLKEVVMRK